MMRSKPVLLLSDYDYNSQRTESVYNVLSYLFNIDNFQLQYISIGYSMFCVGYGIYTTECIFHNQHKTLYNLFSPDPAVSCVGFTS